MIERITHWLTPPVFPAEPLKTRRADFLNITLLAILGFAPLLLVGNLLGGRTPAPVLGIDLAVIFTTLGVSLILRRGHVATAAAISLIVSLIVITLTAISLGTIRTPSTSLYLVVIIMAGVLFDLIGSFVFMALSSLAVLGLAIAETSGWLPRPDYTVTITQWVTYSVLFGCISLFSYFALRRTQQALLRADREIAERQHTEQALRLRTEQLREAQQLAQLGSWAWDIQTQRLSWSDEVYRIFGVTPGEFAPSAQALEEAIHPDDRADFLSRRAQMLAGANTATIDHRIIRRDGEVRWVQERAQVRLNDAGQAARVTGTVQDITALKQAETALQMSDQRYRSLFEDSPISLWEEDFSQVKQYLDTLRQSGVTDLRAYLEQNPAAVNTCAELVQVLNVNQATLDLLEEPDKAAVLTSLSRRLSVEAHAPFREEIIALAQGAQHWVLDETHHTATGRELFITVNVSIAPGYADTWGKVLVSVLDISERKRVEEALRQSEQRYRHVSELITDFAYGFRVEADGTVVKEFATGLLDQLIDQSLDGQDPLGLLQFIVPDDHPRVQSVISAIISGQRVIPFEFRVIYQSQIHWVQGNLRTEWDEAAHRLVRLIGAGSDITERKRAEVALRESQQIIAGILNAAPVRVFWKDKNLNYLGCNAAFARDAGFEDPADIIGKNDYHMGWRNQAELYRADDRLVIDSGHAKLHIEEPQTTPTGATITLLTSKVPLRDAQGEINGVLGTYIDISERKQAELAEREQRALAEALRDTAAALNGTLALNEVLDRILASVERIVPHDAANIMLIDHDVARIVRHRGFAERGVDQFIMAVRFQVNDVPNMRYMLDTGRPLSIADVRHYPGWVETNESQWMASHVAAPLRLKGHVIGFLNLDAAEPQFYTPLHAERLQAFADQAATAIENARLLEAEHTQRLLAEALRDTAAALNSTLDLDEVLERILINVERVLSHDTANLMLIDEHGIARIVRHRGYEERGLAEFAARVRLAVTDVPNLRHMAQTGEPRVMPNVQIESDWISWPESQWIQSIASAPICLKDTTIGFINLNSGTPNFYSAEQGERLQAFANQVAVAVENARLYDQIQQHSQQLEAHVAERTAELQAANLRLTELDRLKDEFLSRISHELRTPLAGILIALELLGMSAPEKRERYALRLKQSTERLREMIEDVLMFSQLNLYTQPATLEPIDLNNLIEGRVTPWQTLSAAHQLSLHLDLAADLPQTRTDSDLIAHALTRLITNAINYTPTGSVTISTALVDELAQRWVTVRITDTGPGIRADELPHIFERFYRGRAAADYKTPGTGIGLSISREIAEKLGGRLTVETQAGAGSTFTLWLPAAQA